MMKNIAVIYGSDSSEWEVSVKSGEFTASQIDVAEYNVFEIFARFGNWSLRAYRINGEERQVVPQETVLVDKTDFSIVLSSATFGDSTVFCSSGISLNIVSFTH